MDFSLIQNQLNQHGFARIPNLLSHHEADRYYAELHKVRLKMNDTFSPDVSGRITYIHTQLPQTLDILLSNQLTGLLKTLMNDQPVLCQAAVYRLGSEYCDHFDRYFYPTDDVTKELTVWIALEDVHPDSGPFYVIPGSQNWPAVTSEYLQLKNPEWKLCAEQLRDPLVDANKKREILAKGIDVICEEFSKIAKEKKPDRMPLILKKGDAVVWRSDLVHGGFKRLNRALTRQCLVGNYIAKNSTLWTTQQFFELKSHEFTKENSRKIDLKPFNDAFYLVDGVSVLGH